MKRQRLFWSQPALHWHWHCMTVIKYYLILYCINKVVLHLLSDLLPFSIVAPPEAPEFLPIFLYCTLKLHHQGLPDLRRAGRIRRLLLRLHFSRGSSSVLSVSFLLNGFRFLQPSGSQGHAHSPVLVRGFMLTEWTCNIPYSIGDDMQTPLHTHLCA